MMASRAIQRVCLISGQFKTCLNSGIPVTSSRISSCLYSTAPQEQPAGKKYKVVVVGGGSGGVAVAAKLKGLGKDVAVVEPSPMHYYQPIWTLVGAGLKTFEGSGQATRDVLPSSCEWIQDKAQAFHPEDNCLELANGDKIHYDYLVVAMGIQLDYDKVPGLQAALAADPSVASNYSPDYVVKTNPALQAFKGGNAIFTFPNTPIKCAGAPQKIMYLADEIMRKNGVRDQANIVYNTSLPVIFGIKKYADALQGVVKAKGINVNYRHNLVSVDHNAKTASFQNLDKPETVVDFKYDFLHVAPPMSAPDVLKASPLVNDAGFVTVDKETLQHDKYKNVFALGDCTSVPTAKTAAAVASQSGILYNNLKTVMAGGEAKPVYDGYTSCPLITSSKTCILAEFDFNGQPLETLPINQGKERYSTYALKAHFMPLLYWKAMVKGWWNGPKFFRKTLHLGMGK